MFLNFEPIKWKFVVFISLAAFLASCATTGGDIQASNRIIQNGNWLLLSASNTSFTYYDPYETKRDANGVVETVIYGQKVSSGQTLTTDILKVDCTGNKLQYFRVTPTGGWELYQDWFLPEPGTTADTWAKSLCLKRNADGDSVEYVGLVNKPNASGQYIAWYWLPEKLFEPAAKGGKTVKLLLEDISSKKFYFQYFYADCSNNRFAISDSLSLKGLDWKAQAPPNSVWGFAFNKSCGTNPSSKKFSDTQTSKVGLPNLTDAKSKCTELGYKKGTEQFGNCVLKLSK